MKLNRTTSSLLSILYLLFVISCGSPTECDEDVQDDEIFSLTKADWERFPYTRLKTLTYRYQDSTGFIDTISFSNPVLDSFIKFYGEQWIPTYECKQPRTRFMKVRKTYNGDAAHPDRRFAFLTMSWLDDEVWAKWNEDSCVIEVFSAFYENPKGRLLLDTVMVMGKSYPDAFRNIVLNDVGDPNGLSPVEIAYSYPYGYVYIHHLKTKQQWWLLNASAQ